MFFLFYASAVPPTFLPPFVFFTLSVSFQSLHFVPTFFFSPSTHCLSDSLSSGLIVLSDSTSHNDSTFSSKYEEAREEERLRSQHEDFSDMVVELMLSGVERKEEKEKYARKGGQVKEEGL
ncbi:splicing factor 3B subunit 2 [Vigna unguiculata]|uniref:Splicing factor 3B subunit 2 n=1 Tax=Vigna unguiculata TaxID=3917 RepID=A0A4D6M8W7_VIGUN|nr:splicing factor 3B subunit 2 [Vigna unguiculata]